MKSAFDYGVNAEANIEDMEVDISDLGVNFNGASDNVEVSEDKEEGKPELDVDGEAQADDAEGEEEAETEEVEEDKPETPSELEINLDATYIVDGEKLSGADLKAHLMRYSDYTQKTQALAEVRGKLKNLTSDLYENSALTQIDLLMQADPALQITQTDLLYMTPEQSQAAIQAYQEAQSRYEGLKEAQLAAIDNIRQEVMQTEQQALMEALPEIKDPQIAQKYNAQIIDVAHSLGFTDDEVAQISDHRFALLALEVAKAREASKAVLEAKTKQVVPPQKLALKSQSSTKVKPSEREMAAMVGQLQKLML